MNFSLEQFKPGGNDFIHPLTVEAGNARNSENKPFFSLNKPAFNENSFKGDDLLMNDMLNNSLIAFHGPQESKPDTAPVMKAQSFLGDLFNPGKLLKDLSPDKLLGGGLPTPDKLLGGGLPTPDKLLGGGLPTPDKLLGGGLPTPDKLLGGGLPTPDKLLGGGLPTPDKLLGGGLPTPDKLFGGGLPTPDKLLGGGLPTPDKLFGGGLPTPDKLFGGGLPTPDKLLDALPTPDKLFGGGLIPSPEQLLPGGGIFPTPDQLVGSLPKPDSILGSFSPFNLIGDFPMFGGGGNDNIMGQLPFSPDQFIISIPFSPEQLFNNLPMSPDQFLANLSPDSLIGNLAGNPDSQFGGGVPTHGNVFLTFASPTDATTSGANCRPPQPGNHTDPRNAGQFTSGQGNFDTAQKELKDALKNIDCDSSAAIQDIQRAMHETSRGVDDIQDGLNLTAGHNVSKDEVRDGLDDAKYSSREMAQAIEFLRQGKTGQAKEALKEAMADLKSGRNQINEGVDEITTPGGHNGGGCGDQPKDQPKKDDPKCGNPIDVVKPQPLPIIHPKPIQEVPKLPNDPPTVGPMPGEKPGCELPIDKPKPVEPPKPVDPPKCDTPKEQPKPVDPPKCDNPKELPKPADPPKCDKPEDKPKNDDPGCHKPEKDHPVKIHMKELHDSERHFKHTNHGLKDALVAIASGDEGKAAKILDGCMKEIKEGRQDLKYGAGNDEHGVPLGDREAKRHIDQSQKDAKETQDGIQKAIDALKKGNSKCALGSVVDSIKSIIATRHEADKGIDLLEGDVKARTSPRFFS